MAAPKKPAVKKEEVKAEEKALPKKYRHEFDSWEEYNNYKGPKG